MQTLKVIKNIAIMILLCVVYHKSVAQFYDTGRGKTDIKWRQINSSNYKIVYPSFYQQPANSIARLMDSIYPNINYGYNLKPKKVPVVLRTQNIYSNGYVTWAPFRQEMVMTPPADTYALSWSKQLTVHEWRHTVQLTSINKGLTKVASWILGQGGSALGLLFVSRWILEGDATIAETQFAEYGRGKQPEFTVEYRALFAEGVNNFKNMDRWLGGSYRYNYPDYYKFGYQILSAADTQFGSDYIGPMMEYAGKWPIVLWPTSIYLKKNYGTTYKKLAQKTFAELDSLWAPFAQVKENFEHITKYDFKNYTNYYDMFTMGDKVLAIKEDYNRHSTLVNIHTNERLMVVGKLSSAPMNHGDKIYYTEYRPHPIFEQVSFSAIREYDTKTQKIKSYHKNENNWHVTPMDTTFATVSMNNMSRFFINIFDTTFRKIKTIRFDNYNDLSLHGLAYDTTTKMLCFIALDRRGMWIGGIDDGSRIVELTMPNVISIRDLGANNGLLYFSSIQSGKNEIHSLDIKSRVQKQLTQSKFGSQMPMAIGDSLLFVTYTAGGNMLAQRELKGSVVDSISWSRKPIDLLNPKWNEWNVPKVDTMNIFQNQPITKNDTTLKTTKKTERYRREFPIHTWAPIAVDPDVLALDRIPIIAFGVAAFFQSTLSNYSGMATYGWLNKSHWVKGIFDYKKLPVTLSLGLEYGGGEQLYYGTSSFVKPENNNQYFNANLTASMPLYFSRNGYSQILQPSVSFSYTNTNVLDYKSQQYSTGLGRYSAQLWWSSNRYLAFRNILPRFGYALRFNVNGAFDKNFATQYMLFGRTYIPGFFQNHAITLKLGLQTQKIGAYNFGSKALYLTGIMDNYATEHYGAIMGEYTLPLWYPDGGWDGVIYFKRITAAIIGGYSLGTYLGNVQGSENLLISNITYGINLGFEMLLFRSFNPALNLIFAAPNNKFFFGMGFNISF